MYIECYMNGEYTKYNELGELIEYCMYENGIKME
jgi:hypothetical protein